MEFKNLERTTFKWFSLREIKELDQVEGQLKFINSFSFGPFVPYNLYHFFHNLWDFYIMELVSNYVNMIIFYIFYIGVIFTGVFKGAESIETMGSTPDFSSLLGSLFPLILTGIVVVLVIFYGVKLFQCFHCRRLSWNRCEWKDYDSFEQGERNWNVVGMIFFILQTLGILIGLALIVIFWNNLIPIFNNEYLIKEVITAYLG